MSISLRKPVDPVDDIAIPPAPDGGTRYRHLVGIGQGARRARFWRFVRQLAEWSILVVVLGMVLVLAGHAAGFWA